MNSLLKKIHLWTGLTLGLLLSVISLSGLLLMYQTTLLSSQHPQLATSIQPSVAQIAAVLEQVSNYQKPDQQLSMLQMPRPDEGHFQIRWKGNQGRSIDYIHAQTFELQLSRSADSDWMLWLFQLHSHLLAGESGQQLLGIMSFIILVMLISGLFVWWPGRKRVKRHLTPPRSGKSTAWLFWSHRFSGVMVAPLLLVAVLTGLGMVYFKPVKSTLIAVFDRQPTHKPQYQFSCPANLPTVPWVEQLNQVASTYPDAQLIRIYPRQSSAKANVFRLKFAEEWHQNGRSYVHINPCSGEVLYQQDAREDLLGARLANLIYPIHSVHVGGISFKVLMTLAALTPPLLFMTGLITWWRRQARKKR